MNVVTLEKLRSKLTMAEPPLGELRRASVAVILKEPQAPSVLLIKRAELAGDPWSGQIAFPGGKAQSEDVSLKGTAVREAREEVGVDLVKDADFLGYFARFTTHTRTIDVFPAVFLLKNETALTPNGEVSSFRWIRLGSLSGDELVSTRLVDVQGKRREVSAILVGEYTIWGLTLRILSSLLS